MAHYRNQPIGKPFMVVHFEHKEPLIINTENQIIRTDMDFTPSEGWKFVVFCDRLGREVSIDLNRTALTRYKNGRGAVWVVDYDHGTRRMHGDRVVEISVYDKDGKYVPPVSKCDRCGKVLDTNSSEWLNCEACGDDLCMDCAVSCDDEGRCKACHDKAIAIEAGYLFTGEGKLARDANGLLLD